MIRKVKGQKRWLTLGMQRILKIMHDKKEVLVYEPGGGWWVDHHRTSGSIAFCLLRLCLISAEQDSRPNWQRYTINEDGRKILDDPEYTPSVIRALRESHK